VATRGLDALPCAVVAIPHAKLLAVGVLTLGLAFGCYHGFDVEDKEPPPGHVGGTCLPEGCYQGGQCYVEENVCLDPTDPCKGIYCGGHGTCGIDLDTNYPFCNCDAGYTNEPYAYFCVAAGL
jgi:hypothetical protein